MSKVLNFPSGVAHFKKEEFTCKCGCNHNNIDYDLVTKLDNARSLAGVPFKINSACRCKEHNKTVLGSNTSSHLKGCAVDIHVGGSAYRFIIIKSLMDAGFKRIGLYKNFIHCDNDNDKPQNVIWYK